MLLSKILENEEVTNFIDNKENLVNEVEDKFKEFSHYLQGYVEENIHLFLAEDLETTYDNIRAFAEDNTLNMIQVYSEHLDDEEDSPSSDEIFESFKRVISETTDMELRGSRDMSMKNSSNENTTPGKYHDLKYTNMGIGAAEQNLDHEIQNSVAKFQKRKPNPIARTR